MTTKIRLIGVAVAGLLARGASRDNTRFRAMLQVARSGFPKKILENPDINAAAGRVRVH